jgi:hypothetical protein
MKDSSYYKILLPVVHLADTRKADRPAIEEGSAPRAFMAEVRPDSPLGLRKAVERLARFFQREFRYDFLQYSATEGRFEDRLSKDRAYLWTLPTWPPEKEIAIGACCFRWREWSNVPPGWGLAWVWFHPFERGKGHLTGAWAYFLQRFPGFRCEPPISSAMRSFLAKRESASTKAE